MAFLYYITTLLHILSNIVPLSVLYWIWPGIELQPPFILYDEINRVPQQRRPFLFCNVIWNKAYSI